MSEPEEQEELPFERSSIAAIGSRRRWHFFGKDEDDADPEAGGEPFERSSIAAIGSGGRRQFFGRIFGKNENGAEPDAAPPAGAEDEPPNRSMLGMLAERAGSLPEPEPDAGPATKSMLALGKAETVPFVDDEAPGPLTQHSTIAELAGLEEHVSGSFPIERGILISIFLHVALVVLLLTLPERIPAGSKGDLFAGLVPEPRDDTPIPVILDAPGPSRSNPKRSPLSDTDRRAGGGDRTKPKAETPFVPPSSGVAGLAPGPRAPRVPGSQAPSRPGAAAEAERRAAAEQRTDQKPSEFPTNARPQTSSPREIGKLAGLDQAIREAARGTVGGEGGSPAPNPEGGFVDSGPISFDTTWYDWGAYAAEMVRRIKLHWDVPELARLGWKGSLTVRFYIMADGTVADAKIIRVSGVPPFDNAAFQAIIKSSPFRPLPADLHEDREGVTVTFFYNMRPESEAQANP